MFVTALESGEAAARSTYPPRPASSAGSSLTGKLTSFVGPLLIGIVTATTASQKAGMAVLVPFLVTGLALLARGGHRPIPRRPSGTSR